MNRRKFFGFLAAGAIALHGKLGELVPIPRLEPEAVTLRVAGLTSPEMFEVGDTVTLADSEVLRIVSVDVGTGEIVVERGFRHEQGRGFWGGRG